MPIKPIVLTAVGLFALALPSSAQAAACRNASPALRAQEAARIRAQNARQLAAARQASLRATIAAHRAAPPIVCTKPAKTPIKAPITASPSSGPPKILETAVTKAGPGDQPTTVIQPGSGTLKAAIPRASGPSGGSITASQQRQAMAIGAVALAAGVAVWMASEEARAEAKEKSAPSFGQGAPSRLSEDNATAHERAVREAIAAAARQRKAQL
jgi:hypothetical protein